MTTTTNSPERTVIYTRISLDRKEEAGVKRQEKACRELASARGYQVTEVYSDNSVSAYSGVERPEYRRLLQDIKAGRVGRVLVWHQDRLHRRLSELSEYIDVANSRNVKTETVMGGSLDLSGATGIMIAQVIGAVSEQESRHKAERIKAAYEQMNMEGTPYGSGHRTFGYTPDRTALNKEEAEALRHVARLILNGGSLYGAANWLTDNGFQTTTGRQFYGGAVKDLLINPRLAGYATHNTLNHEGKRVKSNRKIVGRAKWPAIFTEEEHHQLVSVLKNPSRTKNGGRGTKPQHLGSGIIRCGCETCLKDPDTARVLYVRWKKDKLPSGSIYKRRMLYPKSNEQLRSKGHASRLADPVEEHITRAVIARLSRPDVVEALTRAATQGASTALTEKRTELRDRIQGLENELMAGNMDTAQFGRLNKKLQEQLAELDEQISDYASDDTVLNAVKSAGDDFRAWWVTAGLELQRSLLSAVADVFIVPEKQGAKTFDPNKVLIRWKV